MKATGCRKYINDKKFGRILLKQRCLFLRFSWQNYELTVKVYLFYNVRLNTEPIQVYQAILTHGGPEIIFDEL